MANAHDIVTKSQTAALAFARLWFEAGNVIALRMWGLGLDPHGEDRRMVDEKAPAFARAALAAWQASALAAWRNPFDPSRVAFAGADAWTRSLSRKIRSNQRRLTRSAMR
jgi:hypothetical protein